MSGLLPASLLCAAAGLALGRAEGARGVPLAAAAVVGALAGALALHAPDQTIPTRIAVWTSLALTAAAVLPRRGLPGLWSWLLLLNAGVWAGASAGLTTDLVGALGWLWLAVPTRALSRGRSVVAARVLASWLATIGVLNAVIPLTTPTPGYVRDHLE